MPDLFLLISHELTETQRYEAAEVLGCERIISLPVHLQTSWSNVDSEVEDIGGPAAVFIGWLESNSREGDFCHIQGHFGMTFLLVDSVFYEGIGSVANVASTWLFMCIGWYVVARRDGRRPTSAAEVESVPVPAGG